MSKRFLTIAALVATAIPTCVSYARDVPDGVLGTDYVSVLYTRYADDYGDYDDRFGTGFSDEYYNGFGVGINKNVLDRAKFGVDVNLKYYHVKSSGYVGYYDYTQNSLVASGTVFMKGMVSPFFSAMVYRHWSDIDYTNEAYTDESDSSWALTGKIGVEIHFLPGLSGTLFVAETHSCDGGSTPNNTQYGVSVAYWFTKHIGMSVGEAYINYHHIDESSTSVSLMYHF